MEQKDSIWKQAIDIIEPCPQRQDATMDQLIDLHYVAVKLGFYDAADAIKTTLINKIDYQAKDTVMGRINELLSDPMAAGAYRAGVLDALEAMGLKRHYR